MASLLLPAGLFLLPMAGALLVTTNDWRALSPVPLIAAIRRAGKPYLRTTGAIAPLLAPALLAFLLTLGLPAYTLIAVVGPLSVVPALMAARMMGSMLEQQHQRLKGLFALPTIPEAQTRAPAPARAPRPPADKPAAGG